MPSYVPKHGSSHGDKGVDPIPFPKLGTGDVTGPASAVDGNLAAFDGTTGKVIKDSGNLSADVADAVLKRMFIGDIFSPFVSSGLTATVVGDNKVTIAPGTAYNVQRLHTITDTVLTVSNTGAAHTEYVSVNTAGALIITTTARAADELAVADVSVDAAGVATAVTDVRQRKLHIKVDGIIGETLDQIGRKGIGTTTPSQLLNIVKTHASPTYVKIENSNAAGVSGLYATTNWGGIVYQAIGSTEGVTGWAGYGRLRSDAGALGLVFSTGGADPLIFATGDVERMRVSSNGNISIRTTAAENILTIQQGSATDPIADAWTTYSLREGKTILKDARVLDFDETPVRRWKRKLVKPKLTDFEEKMEEGRVRTREDQLADALEEYTKKKGSQKFSQVQFGVIAEEAPDCLKAYDDIGKLIGINTSAYIGWLHAVVKEQNTTIKDLTTRVQALEESRRLKKK